MCVCVFLQSSGVAQLLDRDVYQPLTLLLPTDGTMKALPREQRDYLLHQDQRPQLVEYLKYHIMPSQKVGPPALWFPSNAVAQPAHQRVQWIIWHILLCRSNSHDASEGSSQSEVKHRTEKSINNCVVQACRGREFCFVGR